MRRILLSLVLGLSICGLTASASAVEAPPSLEAAAFTVTNDGADLGGPRVVSFGHLFGPGVLPAGSSPRAVIGAREAVAQLDAKAFYPDGSVKHAVLSIELPALRANASVHGVVEAPGVAGGPAATAGRPEPPPLKATLVFRSGPEAGQTVVIDLHTLARAAPPADAWLSGPLVQEQRYWSPVVHGIQIAFDVWTPREGAARIDVILHNDLAQDRELGPRRYDIDLALPGRPAVHIAAVTHYPYAVWRRTLYADGVEPPRVTPDTRRLAMLGATPDYLPLQPDPALAAKLHAAAVGDERPLPSGGVTPYMPTSGGRPDIGPLPTWAVIYLLDPTQRNRQTLFADAEAAGSVPWHLRDAATNRQVRIDQHPAVWLDPRGAPSGPLARRYELPATPWQPDTAHQPSLSYLPYLLTGGQFYRDELEAEAAFSLLAVDPQYRQAGAGIVIGQQVRQVAWTLRTLATAAWILPAGEEQRAIEAHLNGNLDEVLRRYVVGHEEASAGELEGFFPGPYGVEGAVAPWQSDYLAMVLGWLHNMGYPQARPILGWMANFTTGRFTSRSRGYDPIYGTPYYLFVADPYTGTPLNRWATAFAATFDPVAKPVASLDYPDWAGGYAALARGALASIANVVGAASAREAYSYVKSQSPAIDSNYAKDPTFAIALHPAAGGAR